MKTNIAKAIINMSCMPCRDTLAHYTQLDRAQTLEQAVTEYIKDCFASTVKLLIHSGTRPQCSPNMTKICQKPPITAPANAGTA